MSDTTSEPQIPTTSLFTVPAVPADTAGPSHATDAVEPPPRPRPRRLRPVTLRPLFQAKSTVQLATATLDALQAHRALLTRADTLHGDVNNNTVLIVEFSSPVPPGSSSSSSFSYGADSTSCFIAAAAAAAAADSESPSTSLKTHGALLDFDLPIAMPGSKPRAVRRPQYFRPPGVNA
ncbi:hypothetical protein C8Q80DRAFT_1266860 [Daedaleopsis nitida]|nr:hypothetical protein C8Q80DRAFT_1266860 [Daedaleopsis nitida]